MSTGRNQSTASQAKADEALLKKLGSPGGTLYKLGYQYQKVLGKGGGGLVGLFKVRAKKDQAAAIKVIDLQERVQELVTKTGKTVKSIRQTLLKYLNKEAKITQIINREIQVCGADANYIMDYQSLDSPDPDYFFMISEPMVADLSRLNRDQITEEALVAIVCQLIYAVACLHRIGLVHGDLKPSNVFLAEDGTIKLGDFGESAYVNIRQSMPANFSLITGMTPTYMAPEVLGENRTPATKYDLWSLGLLILDLLPSQAKPKFKLGELKLMEQSEIDEILAKIKLEDQAIEQVIKGLLKQLLKVDPSQRTELNQLDLESCQISPVDGETPTLVGVEATDEALVEVEAIGEAEVETTVTGDTTVMPTNEIMNGELARQPVWQWFLDRLDALAQLPPKGLDWLKRRLK